MEFEGQRAGEGEPELLLRQVVQPSFERWPPCARRKDHPYSQGHRDTKRKLRPQTGHTSPSVWRSDYKLLHVAQETAPPGCFLLMVMIKILRRCIVCEYGHVPATAHV